MVISGSAPARRSPDSPPGQLNSTLRTADTAALRAKLDLGTPTTPPPPREWLLPALQRLGPDGFLASPDVRDLDTVHLHFGTPTALT
jgi:hypothetical protein